MSDRGFTAEIRGRDRRGYTLAELMLLVALAAILVAIFVDIRRRFGVYNRWISSIAVSADGKRVAAGMMDGACECGIPPRARALALWGHLAHPGPWTPWLYRPMQALWQDRVATPWRLAYSI